MKITSLHGLYVEQIRDLVDAESRIEKALGDMFTEASSPDLKAAFRDHVQLTIHQQNRIASILRDLGEKGSRTCEGIKGIIKEGRKLAKETREDEVRDAGLIASAQKIEHYEISAYGTARTYAQLLGFTRAVELLEQTLQEEYETDQSLTKLAISRINQQAAEAVQDIGYKLGF